MIQHSDKLNYDILNVAPPFWEGLLRFALGRYMGQIVLAFLRCEFSDLFTDILILTLSGQLPVL